MRHVPRYERERIFSVDVECVAIGKTHERSSRAPCEVALVDSSGEVLVHCLIMPSEPIVSYLTPFTGLRRGDLSSSTAVPVEEAAAEIRKHLPPNAVLVGQNPGGDVQWMGLRKGVDFHALVDLAQVYQCSDGTVFSLQHEAFVLLDRRSTQRTGHDPVWDAEVSVALYHKAARASPVELEAMCERLTSTSFWPPPPSVAQRCGYRLDGVCLSMFSLQHCSCGRPIARTWGH